MAPKVAKIAPAQQGLNKIADAKIGSKAAPKKRKLEKFAVKEFNYKIDKGR